MKFTKMHGIGNDYIYVDGFSEHVADPARVSARVSDRHFGIGSDGLILVLPSKVADVRMRMFNADGSESEMCGNGIRCVGKFAYERSLSRSNPMRIETGRGVLSVALDVVDGRVVSATVDMGAPILEARAIPTNLDGDRVVNVRRPRVELRHHPNWAIDCGAEDTMTCVSMGNPHAIIFCGDVRAVPLEHVGPALECDPMFPSRVNVHFVEVISRSEVRMRTWERGSGITLACGTGACAVCVAGVLTAKTDRQVLAHLPGGDLRLEWREESGHVFMTGPATEVFNGEIEV
jgi:diaminopimelate epimerase